jgi:hypothetical protein
MEPILTRYIREPNSHTLDFFLKHGGYEGLRKALGMQPGAVMALEIGGGTGESVVPEVRIVNTWNGPPLDDESAPTGEFLRPEIHLVGNISNPNGVVRIGNTVGRLQDVVVNLHSGRSRQFLVAFFDQPGGPLALPASLVRLQAKGNPVLHAEPNRRT